MRYTRRAVGRRGEEAAAAYLEKSGLVVLEKNYRCRLGEVDIIAQDGQTLVFVEVRSRSGAGFGTAQESVRAGKQHKLRQLAWSYLKKCGFASRPCRFDVVAVYFNDRGELKSIEHIENAFW